MLLSEFIRLRDGGEEFFIIVHKGHKAKELLAMIEYLPYRDPELFFADVNSSEGAQIGLECGVAIYPTFLSFKDGNLLVKEWIND